jgi:ParB family transcriptional regulator, chromosome partitioning protein
MEMKMQKAVNNNGNEYQMIPMESLEDSTTNPRKRIDEAKLQELAGSIKETGIYSPLLVRPLEGKRFQVVFGRRRYLAAQLAGEKAAPCRIREMSDSEVLEAQIVENGQRQDIHPLEEGSAYKALLELPDHKHTPATIAAKTGKSETYVTGRLRLTELVPEIQTVFLEDQISIAHALLIAKLPASQQPTAYTAAFRQVWTGDGHKPVLMPAKELEAWIQQNILMELSAAPFSKDDEALLPQAGSCANCPKRTGFNHLLFSEVRKDSCTDPQCFQAKLDAHVSTAVTKKPQLVQISNDYRTRESVLGKSKYVELQVKKRPDSSKLSPEQKPCRNMAEAIFSDGGRKGQIVKVCADANCKVHRPDSPKPEDVEKQRAQERKRIEAQKVEITIRHQVFAQVLQKVPVPFAKTELELIAMRLLDKLDYQRRVLIAKRHKLISAKSVESDHNEMVSGFKKMFKESDDKAVCRLILECILIDSAYHVPTSGDDLLLSTAKRYRIDAEKVARQVRDDLAAKAKKKAAKAKKTSKTTAA